jgi:predicted ferric reductase
MGRIVVLESVLHTICWLVVCVADKGWEGAIKTSLDRIFLTSGWIGTIAMVLIFLTSFGPVRHAFYETFLNAHIILGLIAFICTLIHCKTSVYPGGLPMQWWIIAILILWGLDRLARLARMAYANWSRHQFTHAVCEPMPGDVTRVTMHLPRYMDIKPGTHAYLRFWGVNLWESHPFSIAWIEHNDGDHGLPISEKDPLAGVNKATARTSVSFLIGAQTGMTRKLFEKAKQGASTSYGRPSHGIQLRAAFEGPYAGHHSLDSYGHAVLFAGSTGITHQISYVRHLLEGYNAGTVATRRLTLVWIIREYDSLEWVRPYMDTILRIPNRKDLLRINIFVTRPNNARDITSASNTVRMFPGRPNIPLLLVKEVGEQVGAMCVTVCGPGALADDVRGAVRTVQGDTVVDFVEESFTW